MTAAAIKATYSDWRTVKSRKVLQLVFEVPIEQQTEVLGMLGAPGFDAETWYGIARLKPAVPVAAPEGMEQADKPKRRMDELPLSQQAALLCGREAFWRFVNERIGDTDVNDEATAAAFLRGYCDVTSRSEIIPGTKAAGRFNRLHGEFSVWMANP